MGHQHRSVRAVLMTIPLVLFTTAVPAGAATILRTQPVAAAPTQAQMIKNLRAQVRRLNRKVATLQKQLNAAKAELARAQGTTTTTAPATTTTRPSATTATPGTTTAPDCTAPCANAGGFKVMVSDFRFNVSSGNQFIEPEDGNVFVTLDVTFANGTSSTKTASPFDFRLEDGAGVIQSTELLSPCDIWSSAMLTAGGSLGPKCLGFEATANEPTGLTLEWKPGLFTTYEIPLS